MTQKTKEAMMLWLLALDETHRNNGEPPLLADKYTYVHTHVYTHVCAHIYAHAGRSRLRRRAC